MSAVDISEYHPALGFFIFFTFISVICGLSKVFGKPTGNYLFGFIICKKWRFMDDKSYLSFGYFFSIIYYILLSMPVIAILTWVGIMFYIRRNDTYVSPISILLVSLSGASFILGQRYIIWKRYRLTWTSIILIILSIVFIVAYQLLGNFYYSLETSFLALSAIFLSYNCVVVIVLMYLNISKEFLKFEDVLKKFVKSTAEGFELHSKFKDLVQCIEEDSVNDKYALTIPEHEAFVTIIRDFTTTESCLSNILKTYQGLINVFIYLLSLAILVVYSVTAYQTEYEKLGITISIAVVATDIVLYTLYHSDVIGTIGGGCIMAIIFRGCLFGFGGKYWYFGCCLLYALAGIKVAFEKVKQQFPFVETKHRSLNVPVNDSTRTNVYYKMDILREPIVAWLIASLLFCILTVILAFTEPNGVDLPELNLGERNAPFWLMAIFSFLLSLFCYFMMATVRIAILKSMKYIPRIFRYFLREGMSEIWMYMILAYIVIVSSALILYYFIQSELIIIYSIYCPLIAIILYYTASVYAHNNYSILYGFQSEARKELLRLKRIQAESTKRRTRNASSETILASYSEDTEEEGEQIEDWRKKTHCVAAFFNCMLHSRDYKIIVSIIVTLILTFFLGFTIQVADMDSGYRDAWIGITTSIMIFCTILVVGSMFDHLSTGLRMSIPEIFILVLGAVIYLVYGLAFYIGREGGDKDRPYYLYTLPIYSSIYPAIVTISMGIYSIFTHKKITRACYALWGFTIILLNILVIFVYLVWGVLEGTIVLLVIGFIALGLITYVIISYLSFKGRILTVFIVISTACGIMIYDFCEDKMDNYIGFSISYLLITGGVFITSGFSIIMGILNWSSSPIIFSPLIIPAFKYKPFLSYPIPYYGKIYALYISIGAVVIWSVLLSVYVEPMHYGITIGLFTIIFALVISIYLSTYTPYNFKIWADHITDKTINSSWLKAKDHYIKRQGVTTLNELATFKQTLDYKKKLIALDKELAERNVQPDSQREDNYLHLNYRNKLMWLHSADKRIFALYQSELLFSILFQMITLMAAQTSTTKEQQDLVRFVRTKRAQLKKYGIHISLKNVNDLDLRYYWILSQKEGLSPEQKVGFNKEWNKYQKEKLEKEKRYREQEAKVQQKLREKLEMEHDENSGKNIAKYKQIVEEYKRSNKKYIDLEFPCDTESLGNSLSSQVSFWRRATQDPTAKIFFGTVNPTDLIQGALGDCYLLSAVSVMGEKNIRLCIKSKEEDASSGAFLVKMFKGGEYEEYVIIDDYFPVGRDGNWLFAQSDSENKNTTLEMWPMIIEKAYAKLYKSYERIEGGKVHIALAELTGGIPQYIKITDSIQDNLDEFWEKLYNYHDNDYMLGAGTPENVLGHSAVNQNGIVQGHAYAIIKIVNYQDEKLIKLRNPHGSRGIEWNGDWSDSSSLWTAAATEALGLEVELDGVFWMNVQDFVEEFKYVYICRKFDMRWTVIHIEDQCSSHYTLKDHGFDKFPQYEVQVTKPTTIFVKMIQSEKHNSFQGKYSIFVVLMANNGEIAKATDTNNMIASSLPPINYVSVTTELFADILYTYPYTFTAIAGVFNSTSKFNINFFSTDPNLQVRKIN